MAAFNENIAVENDIFKKNGIFIDENKLPPEEKQECELINKFESIYFTDIGRLAALRSNPKTQAQIEDEFNGVYQENEIEKELEETKDNFQIRREVAKENYGIETISRCPPLNR